MSKKTKKKTKKKKQTTTNKQRQITYCEILGEIMAQIHQILIGIFFSLSLYKKIIPNTYYT